MTFRNLYRFTLSLSVILVIASIVLFVVPGPRFSIEFTGGTLMQLELPEGKTQNDVTAALASYEASAATDLGNVTVNAIKTATEEAFLLRLRPMSNEEHLQLLEHFRTTLGDVTELKYNSIGPSLSASLKVKSLQAIALASLVIIAYLALAFRKLPGRLSAWKFGVIVVASFVHDIIITTGLFTILSLFTSFEFDTLFVTALLTILAYSTNEAVVVFDRIRANLSFENRNDDLETVTATALRQCIGRTTGTTVAILIMLTTLFFMGAESIRWFILALIFGAISGVYSSYLVAAPLLVLWQGQGKGKRK